MQRQLVENPPVDHLAQIYLIASKLWSPPERAGPAHAVRDDAGPMIWESPQLGELD